MKSDKSGYDINEQHVSAKCLNRLRKSIYISICITGSFLGLMVFELYLAYQNEFLALYKYKMLFYLLTAIAVAALFVVLLYKLPERFFGNVIAIMIGVALLLYIICLCDNVPDVVGKAWQGNTDHSGENVHEFEYQLGETLSFGESGTAKKFCQAGFSFEPTQTWTSENYAKMYFELMGKYDTLLLEFDYDVYAPPQKVYLYANGNEIDNCLINDAGDWSVMIPAKYVKNNKLKLEFVFPNATSPAARGESGDVRLLTLNIHNMCISEAGNVCN